MDLRIGNTIYLNNEFLKEYTAGTKSSYGFEIIAATDNALKLKNIRSGLYYTLALTSLMEYITYPNNFIKKPVDPTLKKIYTPTQTNITIKGSAVTSGPIVLDKIYIVTIAPITVSGSATTLSLIDYSFDPQVSVLKIMGSAICEYNEINTVSSSDLLITVSGSALSSYSIMLDALVDVSSSSIVQVVGEGLSEIELIYIPLMSDIIMSGDSIEESEINVDVVSNPIIVEGSSLVEVNYMPQVGGVIDVSVVDTGEYVEYITEVTGLSSFALQGSADSVLNTYTQIIATVGGKIKTYGSSTTQLDLIATVMPNSIQISGTSSFSEEDQFVYTKNSNIIKLIGDALYSFTPNINALVEIGIIKTNGAAVYLADVNVVTKVYTNTIKIVGSALTSSSQKATFTYAPIVTAIVLSGDFNEQEYDDYVALIELTSIKLSGESVNNVNVLPKLAYGSIQVLGSSSSLVSGPPYSKTATVITNNIVISGVATTSTAASSTYDPFHGLY